MLFAPVMCGRWSKAQRACTPGTRQSNCPRAIGPDQPAQANRPRPTGLDQSPVSGLLERDKPAGEPAIGADGTIRSSTHWEASDQRVFQTPFPVPSLNRHSREWRFARQALFLKEVYGHCVAKPEFAALITKGDSSPKGYLPHRGLPCTIGVAYQAADAGHPGVGRACSPRSKRIQANHRPAG
jgi:hypothetical protein